ncbi:MAG: pitrilysin family protein, partial [Pseudomonadota bacterium]
TVIFIPLPQQFTTHVRWVNKTGLANSDALVRMTKQLLTYGSQKLPNPEFAETVAMSGNDLTYSTSLERTEISVSVLAQDLEQTLRLLALNVQYPDWRQKNWQAMQNQLTLEYKAMNTLGSSLAYQGFNQLLYPKSHPYGQIKSTIGELEKTRLPQIESFYQQHFKPENSALILAGQWQPFSQKEVMQWITQYFSHNSLSLKASKNTTKDVKIIEKKTEAYEGKTIHIIDRQGAAQADIYVGAITVAKLNTDWFALHFASTLLGGGAHSRLFRDIREQRGLAYSISAAQTNRKMEAPFYVRTNTANEKVAATLRGIQQHFQALIDVEIPQNEIQLNQDFLLGRLASNFETPEEVAARAAYYFALELPSNYLQTYQNTISRINAQEIKSIARKYLVPEKMIFLIVADYDWILPQIRQYLPEYQVTRHPAALSIISQKQPQ